jgi:hypothetical protein
LNRSLGLARLEQPSSVHPRPFGRVDYGDDGGVLRSIFRSIFRSISRSTPVVFLVVDARSTPAVFLRSRCSSHFGRMSKSCWSSNFLDFVSSQSHCIWDACVAILIGVFGHNKERCLSRRFLLRKLCFLVIDFSQQRMQHVKSNG